MRALFLVPLNEIGIVLSAYLLAKFFAAPSVLTEVLRAMPRSRLTLLGPPRVPQDAGRERFELSRQPTPRGSCP